MPLHTEFEDSIRFGYLETELTAKGESFAVECKRTHTHYLGLQSRAKMAEIPLLKI